jgi:probable F420-dependent oxidoreductase
MTPFFNPGPIAHPDVPIYLAAVGPAMCRLVGEAADGIHIHPFHTRRYIEETVGPAIVVGAVRRGRDPAAVTRVATLFVVTGRDAGEMERSAAAVRNRIAFYASTPAYRAVLDLHGWAIGDELTAMSKRGEWSMMGALVDDEMLETVAVVAPIDRIVQAIEERCEGTVDRLGLVFGEEPPEGELARLIEELAG